VNKYSPNGELYTLGRKALDSGETKYSFDKQFLIIWKEKCQKEKEKQEKNLKKQKIDAEVLQLLKEYSIPCPGAPQKSHLQKLLSRKGIKWNKSDTRDILIKKIPNIQETLLLNVDQTLQLCE